MQPIQEKSFNKKHFFPHSFIRQFNENRSTMKLQFFFVITNPVDVPDCRSCALDEDHSTAASWPIHLQRESFNSGVWANRRSTRYTQQSGSGQSRSNKISEQWCSGQSVCDKNHSTVGFVLLRARTM